MASSRELVLEDPRYPTALRSLVQPPPVLHVKGRLELLSRPGIGVIGTRAHSVYGRDATVSFVVGLVCAGYTIGVLGTGLDVPYPPEHEELIRAVAEHGCLVSEFPHGTPPRRYHFPQRNRIIAGLSRGVLVVEAPESSGAMNTAQHALEGGKEVFAVPGPIHNPTSAGTNRLIQDGAALVTSVADILHVLESRTGEPLPEPVRAGLNTDRLDEPLHAAPDPAASALAHRLWLALEDGPCDVEGLGAQIGADPASLAAALLELELAGLVRKLPGPSYARAALQAPLGTNEPA